MQVLVVVASATGRTLRMAEAFADGVRGDGGEARLVSAEDAQPSDWEAADAIALGSGVHMAGIESSMRACFERTAPLWMQGRLAGKVGAAFVSAGAGGRGGAELSLLSLLALLAEHGLVLVSMPSRTQGFSSAGCHWGPVAWTNPRSGSAGPTEAHLEATRDFGRHVARCTARWLRGETPGTPSPRPPDA